MPFYDVITADPVQVTTAERIVPGDGPGPEPPGPPPSITWLDPEPGSAIRRAQPITVRVTDSDLVLCILSVRFERSGIEELVFRRGEFSPMYRWSTALEESNGILFTVRRSRGWPIVPTSISGIYERAIFSVNAVDAEGQVGS